MQKKTWKLVPEKLIPGVKMLIFITLYLYNILLDKNIIFKKNLITFF